MNLVASPIDFLNARDKRHLGVSYKLLGGPNYGLDVLISDNLEIDESRMAVRIPFADGKRRDGVGDLLEVGGIRTDRHHINPIILFDHAKSVSLPIAQAQDPDSGSYTVIIDPVMQEASAWSFFYQGKDLEGVTRERKNDHALFCEQLFDLTVKKFIRAGSIGYSVIQAKQLQPNYETGTPAGLHLLSVLMLEASLVVLPANADTVLKVGKSIESDLVDQILAMPKCCNKPLSPYLVKSLSGYAAENKKCQVGFDADLAHTIPNSRQGNPEHVAGLGQSVDVSSVTSDRFVGKSVAVAGKHLSQVEQSQVDQLESVRPGGSLGNRRGNGDLLVGGPSGAILAEKGIRSGLLNRNLVPFHESSKGKNKSGTTIPTHGTTIPDHTCKSQIKSHEGEDCPHCGASMERGDDGNCNRCGKPWPADAGEKGIKSQQSQDNWDRGYETGRQRALDKLRDQGQIKEKQEQNHDEYDAGWQVGWNSVVKEQGKKSQIPGDLSWMKEEGRESEHKSAEIPFEDDKALNDVDRQKIQVLKDQIARIRRESKDDPTAAGYIRGLEKEIQELRQDKAYSFNFLESRDGYENKLSNGTVPAPKWSPGMNSKSQDLGWVIRVAPGQYWVENGTATTNIREAQHFTDRSEAVKLVRYESAIGPNASVVPDQSNLKSMKTKTFARQSGWQGHRQGVPIAQNPYQPNSPEHRDWVEGWNESSSAKKESKPSPFKIKELQNLRKKYRKTKGLSRRIKRSQPGSSTVWVRQKDLQKCQGMAKQLGLKSSHVGGNERLAKVKLMGHDDGISAVAKEYGRRVKILAKKGKSMQIKGHPEVIISVKPDAEDDLSSAVLAAGGKITRWSGNRGLSTASISGLKPKLGSELYDKFAYRGKPKTEHPSSDASTSPKNTGPCEQGQTAASGCTPAPKSLNVAKEYGRRVKVMVKKGKSMETKKKFMEESEVNSILRAKYPKEGPAIDDFIQDLKRRQVDELPDNKQELFADYAHHKQSMSIKSLNSKGKSTMKYSKKDAEGMIPGDQPDVPPPAEDIAEDAVAEEALEPYGVQVMRRLHQDHSILLQEYDEMMGLLEHEGVKAHLQSILETLSAKLDETEELFDEAYSEFDGLSAESGDEGEKDLENVDEAVDDEAAAEDEGAPVGDEEAKDLEGDNDDPGDENVTEADSTPEDEPSGDDVVEGMQKSADGDADVIEEDEERPWEKGMKAKHQKTLRAKYGKKGLKDDDDEDEDKDDKSLKGKKKSTDDDDDEDDKEVKSIVKTKSVCAACKDKGKESCTCDEKSLKGKKKSVCAACKEKGKTECTCDTKSLNGKKKDFDEMDVVEEDAEVTNAEKSYAKALDKFEKYKVKEAGEYLNDLTTKQDFDELDRHKAYHHHRTLGELSGDAKFLPALIGPVAGAAIGAATSAMSGGDDKNLNGKRKDLPPEDPMAGDPSADLVDPTMQGDIHPHRKMCKDVSDFMEKLSTTRDFGNIHRDEAKHWHRSLEPISKEDEEMQPEEGEANEDAPGLPEPGEMGEKALTTNRLKAIFEQQTKDIASLNQLAKKLELTWK